MESRPAPKPELSPEVQPASVPRGEFVTRDGELYYRIAAYHRLDPFLMTLASDTDLWMFVASGGGLTAGRVDPDGSLFPYRTVDQLHEAHHHTGPLTVLRVEQPEGEPLLWEPFREFEPRREDVERNLYKNTVGNRLVFEETRPDLGLAFSYGWGPSEDFGWVRTATLTNTGDALARVSLLDGLRNILPFGAPLGLHQQASNLVDAYKKSEADPESGLGIFSLTAGITDRAEALESLQASVVWCCGLEGHRVHLSAAAATDFRKGRVMTEDAVRNGVRGNYLISSELDLAPGQAVTWHLVADTGCDHARVVALRRRLLDDRDLAEQITASLDRTTANLRAIVAGADGLQFSGYPEGWSHHFANVLFNSMRGGVFDRNNDVPVADFRDFLEVRNREVAGRWRTRLQDLPETVSVTDLRALGRDDGDTDFVRLCHEYLPLYFGRRHGDPSRPWNRFAIRVRGRTGERVLNYQGNWRDIFQNWEALSLAFPEFLPSLVAKFVNASTVDGFNPYRITREGIDWEIESPDDPWSNIGYWGDHQIIYLLRLLEAWNDHDPDGLVDMLGEAIYSYADVPYRLKPYAQILQSPDDTIDFDTNRAAEVDARVADLGSDGKLLPDGRGGLQQANLLEKLLVPALSKLSNLVPDGGIWMNTQRPEWNDANNALAGGGISVVTLCYLRRYLSFLADLLDRSDSLNLDVATEVSDWFEAISSTLSARRDEPARDALTAQDRKQLMDALGGAFETYREAVYDRGFTGRSPLSLRQVGDFCRQALRHVDASIAANRRPDGLYHTYNVLHLTEDGTGAEILRLQEMLEGQVAVLSAGVLQPAEALCVIEQLYASGNVPAGPGQLPALPATRSTGLPGEEPDSRRAHRGRTAAAPPWSPEATARC